MNLCFVICKGSSVAVCMVKYIAASCLLAQSSSSSRFCLFSLLFAAVPPFCAPIFLSFVSIRARSLIICSSSLYRSASSVLISMSSSDEVLLSFESKFGIVGTN